MDPSIGDMLDGAADVLEQRVAPLVPASDRAAANLADVIAVLRRIAVTWDEIVPHLVAQNDGLASLLASASEELRATAGADGEVLALCDSLDAAAAAPSPPRPPRFDEVNELNVELRRALAELIELTARHELSAPREEVRAWLRQTLDRELELSGAELRAPHTTEPSVERGAGA